MERKTFYYARVSSASQHLDRQLECFYALGATDRDIITDKESGKDLERAGYQALRNTILRSGDTLVVKSLDRLSRNKSDIKNELQYFRECGIRVKVIDLPTTMMELPDGQEWVFEMPMWRRSSSLRITLNGICGSVAVMIRSSAMWTVKRTGTPK